MPTKTVSLDALLSAYTGVLVKVRDDSFEAMGLLLDFMTGDTLYTHQLPRAADEVRPYLLDQFPWLAQIDASGLTSENINDRYRQWVEQYGEMHTVRPIPKDDHDIIDPIEELRGMMNPHAEIIIIDPDSDDTIGDPDHD